MGGCQSVQNTLIPSLQSNPLENKFKVLEKRKFSPPQVLYRPLQSISSNGKISDSICKITTAQFPGSYLKIDVSKNLDSENKFTDKDFLPNQQSIGKEQTSQVIQWKRPSKFLKDEYFIFQGEIEPLDIRQGKLGNCYFLSALSAISEYPFIIKKIFETTEVSTYGVYGVWLFIDGLWQCIAIDDYLPLHHNKPIFSRNHGNQIWVMLMEKAYAKIFQSYYSIQAGLTGIALNALTGAPYEYLSRDSKTLIDVQVAWTFLTEHISNNHFVCGSSQNNDRNEYLGLVSSHAYTVLDVKQVYTQTKTGKRKQRILQLSNPWGKYEWKGRWSEESDVWNQQLREQLKFQKADDGIFWIGLEDFVQNFGQICACKYDKNYLSTSLPLKFNLDEEKYFQNQFSGFKGVFLNTTVRTQGYLSLIQTDHRHFLGTKYQYSPARVIVLKIQKSTKQLNGYINDAFDCDHDMTIKIELEPGDYYVFIEIDWKSNYSRNAVLNFYGQHFIGMAQDEQQISPTKLFNQVILLHEKFTQKERMSKYAKDQGIVRATGSIAGYVYYHYSNKSTQNNYLCENVILKQRQHIEVYGEQDKEQFTVRVFPGEQQIVTLRVLKQGNGLYTFLTSIQNNICQRYTLQKLRQLTDKKYSKLKRREIDGKQIEVVIKTFNYSGGVALLYQNNMDRFAYVEEITFQIQNLQLQNEPIERNKLQIELQPQKEKLLSFVIKVPGKPINFRSKMSFYLNTPEFRF